MKDQITYIQVLELGFERTEVESDNVFYNRHGYTYFFMSKTILSGLVDKGNTADKVQVIAEWDPVSRQVKILTTDQEGEIHGQLEITDHDELMRIFRMFDKNI